MKIGIRFKLLLLVLLLCIVALTAAVRSYTIPIPTGVWKDVSEDYYVVFYDDGTYSETDYNLGREFTYADGTLTLYDIAGQAVSATIPRSYRGRMTLNINGVVRTLERTQKKPNLYQWDAEPTGEPIAGYKLGKTFASTYYLRLYEDHMFVSMLGTERTVGKYVNTTDGHLLLLTRGGGSIECLTKIGEVYAAEPMDTQLTVKVLKANPLEDRGLELSGFATNRSSGLMYEFLPGNIALRTDSHGGMAEFLYFATSDGHITLTDTVGAGVEDTLYLDEFDSTVYRYVIEPDSWVDFLINGGSHA